MPKRTRQIIYSLPHKKVSGLFLTQQGEYVADVNPDDGKRVIRKMGRDRACALGLFDDLRAELDRRQQARHNPLLTTFMADVPPDSMPATVLSLLGILRTQHHSVPD